GEVRVENVEPDVCVIVSDAGSHTGLLAATLIERNASIGSDIVKCPVLVVMEEFEGRGIAGDVNVGPAVVIVVDGGNAEAVVPGGIPYAAGLGNIDEFA